MEQIIDFGKIIKRLGIIKGFILLEEFNDAQNHVDKLKGITDNLTINGIIKNFDSKFYSDTIIDIEKFINDYQKLVVYEDSEIESLKIEIKKLEITISTLSDEIADTEKLIHRFGLRHSKELGEIVSKILKYRKEKKESTKDESDEKKMEYEEAKEDYEKYSKQYDENKLEEQFELTEEEQKELKIKYRKATKLCHPDVVADELKENAEIVFRELHKAYEKNDLKKVKEIYEMLEKGEMFISKSESITEKVKLKAELIKLRNKTHELKTNLNVLINSETYIAIVKIDDWDMYFNETKEKLKEELNAIESYKDII